MAVAWVTGARGFIGRHLTVLLRARGFDVCGVGHGSLPAELWSQAGLVSWLNSQISAEALGHLLSERGPPEAVFHLAGGSTVGASLSAPLEDFDRTVTSTAVLLEWLRSRSPRSALVVASSAAVYGDTQGAQAVELRRPMPMSPYGYHKLMMEQLCQQYAELFGLRITVLRLFSVYGEGLRKQLLWDCAVRLTAGGERLELAGSGDELRDWVHVDDAVAMLERVVQLAGDACPVYNGGSGVGVRVREIVTLLANALHCPQRLEFSGSARRGDPRTLVADAARLMATGHRNQVTLENGVQRYADWFNRTRAQ